MQVVDIQQAPSGMFATMSLKKLACLLIFAAALPSIAGRRHPRRPRQPSPIRPK